MIEIVFWSCVLGFVPIVLGIVWSILAMIAGPAHRDAARPLAFYQEVRIHHGTGLRRIARAGGFIHGR